MTKVCSKCHRDLPVSEFHTHNGTSDRLQSKCRSCVKAYRAEYYLKNQERLREYSATFYAANATDVKAYQRGYAERNQFAIRERGKKYRSGPNRDVVLAKKRVDYLANKDRRLAQCKLHKAQHPEYARRSHHHRRAQKFGVSGTFTARSVIEKFAFFGWCCYLCGTAGTIHTLEIDHRKPMSRGGTNWIANIAPACSGCNQKKRQRTEQEYRASLPP